MSLVVRNGFSHFRARGALPDLSMEEQDEETLCGCGAAAELQAHESGKTISLVCNTPQRDHKVLNLGDAVCVDTHAYADGWLTCLELETGVYWQANELGETRQLQMGKAVLLCCTSINDHGNIVF